MAELFRGEREWRVFFRKACEESPERLRSQAKQLRDELHARGDVFKLEEVEDVLLALAREKLPESPPLGGGCGVGLEGLPGGPRAIGSASGSSASASKARVTTRASG